MMDRMLWINDKQHQAFRVPSLTTGDGHVKAMSADGMTATSIADRGRAAGGSAGGDGRHLHRRRASNRHATLSAPIGQTSLGKYIFAGLLTRNWDLVLFGASRKIPVVYVTGDSEGEWTSYGVLHSILIHKSFASAQILTAVTSSLNSALPEI